MQSTENLPFTAVYGPVNSWRYGRSLGIDPIGPISTCSFNCVYCQLGEIEHPTADRQIFIPTDKILQDLQKFAPWNVDAITLSGSGEPTQALNLGEILSLTKQLTLRPTVVLTNATLLRNPNVRNELALADKVAVKLDTVSPDQLRRINRPVPGINWLSIWTGLYQFRRNYHGHFAIQTMLLSSWNEIYRADYIKLMQFLKPDEIQLNTPTRPKPTQHQLDARGNHSPLDDRPYPVNTLKQLNIDILSEFATEIRHATGIPVRCPPV